MEAESHGICALVSGFVLRHFIAHHFVFGCAGPRCHPRAFSRCDELEAALRGARAPRCEASLVSELRLHTVGLVVVPRGLSCFRGVGDLPKEG